MVLKSVLATKNMFLFMFEGNINKYGIENK